MTDPKIVMYEEGRRQALALKDRAPNMTGTEIIQQENNVSYWLSDKDYSTWPVGSPVADEGQIWLLIIPHRAADYSGRPSSLRALWGLAHTKDQNKAKSWVSSYGTSGLYKLDECCTYPHPDGTIHVWRNLYDNNEYPPLTMNVESRWEDLGEVFT